MVNKVLGRTTALLKFIIYLEGGSNTSLINVCNNLLIGSMSVETIAFSSEISNFRLGILQQQAINL